MIKLYRKDIMRVVLYEERPFLPGTTLEYSYYGIQTLDTLRDKHASTPKGWYNYYITEVPIGKSYIYVTKHPMWAKRFVKSFLLMSNEDLKETRRIYTLERRATSKFLDWMESNAAARITDSDEKAYLDHLDQNIEIDPVPKISHLAPGAEVYIEDTVDSNGNRVMQLNQNKIGTPIMITTVTESMDPKGPMQIITYDYVGPACEGTIVLENDNIISYSHNINDPYRNIQLQNRWHT